MSEWKRGEMPRAFLVKNNLRRANVDDDNSVAVHGGSGRDAGRSRCSMDHENANTDDLTQRTDADLTHPDRTEGSKRLYTNGVVGENFN